MKSKKETLSALKKKLDTEFSWYIRNRDGGRCYTCGVVRPPKEMQAGHYISRVHLVYRWDERNVHCQCVACNRFKYGDLVTYRERLVEQYGARVVKSLEAGRFGTMKMTAELYHELIDHYRELNRGIE